MIAIIPAGGRGLRMAAVTHGASKEALPLGGRTVLDFVLDEAFAAGAVRAVVVSARDKSDIETIVAARPEHVDLRFQESPLGLAHAVASARECEDDALILLPDTVYETSQPSALLAANEPTPDAAVLAVRIDNAEVGSYGVIECNSAQVTKILEKPSPNETSSRLAVAARYFLTDRALRFIRQYVETPSASGEWDMTSALNRAILHAMTLDVVITTARRYDCGNPQGYREACAAFD